MLCCAADDKRDSIRVRVHRAVLVARSSVFRAMFQHDMREKRHSRLCLPNFSAEVRVFRDVFTESGNSGQLFLMVGSFQCSAEINIRESPFAKDHSATFLLEPFVFVC